MFSREHVIQNRESTNRVRACESCVHPVFNQSSGGFICIIRVWLPAGIFYRLRHRLPLWKINITPQFFCLWSKIIRKASQAHHKFFFYVEYSRTLKWFFEDSKFAYKTTNFTQNDMCATSDKNTNFDISKHFRCKVEISNSLCSRTV